MTEGLIAAFARHRTAANLLMVVMLVVGVFSLNRMTTQFFPDFGIEIITVGIVWPGASADDVDASIVQAVEPEVRFIDGVDTVRSTSVEGVANVVIEFVPGTDMQAALADVEAAVAQVVTLPEGIERPIISRLIRYDTISRLLISGPYPERSLKAFAKRIRDDLLARGIDRVSVSGMRDEEITIEIPPATLRRLDLSLDDVARRISEASVDLPLGVISGTTERQLRTLGLVKTAEEIGDLELKPLASGRKVYIRDIALVRETFDDDQVELRRSGYPAIDLNVQRALTNDALVLAEILDRYLEKNAPTWPANLRVERHDEAVSLIESRIDLLLRNGAGGLALVLLILFLFLNWRVAFWVAAGIPVSIMAAMGVMLLTGQSINMVSLFGLIMVIGIVVDDAIVVGEHVEARFRRGISALEAALTGAKRMAAPVVSASLTTMAAFLPLLVISDVIGQIIAAIPMVVISVVAASLVEAFLVLPGHLHHSLAREGKARNWITVGLSRRVGAFRRAFDDRFVRFRDVVFRRLVQIAVEWRLATLAGAVSLLIVAVGLERSGRVDFVFFPSPEADRIFANFELAVGSPRENTEAMLKEMERALHVAANRLTAGEQDLIIVALSNIGGAVSQRSFSTSTDGDSFGGMIVELAPSDHREVRTDQFIEAWKKEIVPVPGLLSLSVVAAQAGPPGRWIDIGLSGRDTAKLKAAAEQLKKKLATYPGVSDLEDNMPWGKPEIILEITPRGQSMGFTNIDVGRQVRNAFEGAIATRFARGDEEVLVRVKFPKDETRFSALDTLYLRSPSGAEVPLTDIVTLLEKRGFALVYREDGVKRVSVGGELDTDQANLFDILTDLESGPLPEIAARYGVDYNFGGKAEEQERTVGDMQMGALVALVLIYVVLAWIFASYSRPFVVMSIIPFGLIGAVVGHLVLGYDLTILSLVALVGLSGIVVNDSIILVNTIEERIERGESVTEAAVDGACDRFRAVLLTSATTIGGLTPLLFEKSLQAQFLIPMAVTIVFGLLGTTLLVLFVVPALVTMQIRSGSRMRAFVRTLYPMRGSGRAGAE